MISIVMSVYNGEKYLCPCIDSVLAQTYKDWELIIVDDGSTDDSATICDDYASRYPQIRVVHQENCGQAVARNKGLQRAKGDYVSFIDCDDWLSPEMYDVMLATLQEQGSDAVICGYSEEYLTYSKGVNDDGQMLVYGGEEAAKQILEGQIGSYLWTMLFSRRVLVEPIPDMRYFEDHAVIYKWMLHCSKVVCLHRPFYHYRQLQGSCLHRKSLEKEWDYFEAVRSRFSYIRDKQLLPGWEAENRRLFIRACVKLTKDLARNQGYGQLQKNLFEAVKKDLERLQPIDRKTIGTKYFVRLRLLMANTKLYVILLRLSSCFTLLKRKKEDQLFR